MTAPPTSAPPRGHLGFEVRCSKQGDAFVLREGRVVTILRGARARALLDRMARASPEAQQQLLARITGNYRQGNERLAAMHRRN